MSRHPRVTRLRGRDRSVEVDLDGGRWRSLPVEVAVRAGLAVGRELDRPLARTLARELRRSRALAAAGRVLRARDCSARELDERLARNAIPASARAEAVATLRRAGILDDERFAAGRAAVLGARGRSDAAIRADLEQHGVPPDELEAALEQLPPERDRAAEIVAARGVSVATARRLAALGFGEDAIEAALGGLVADDAA